MVISEYNTDKWLQHIQYLVLKDPLLYYLN
jgi:hypothetical protein